MKNILSVRSYFTQEQIEDLLNTAGCGSRDWAESLLEYESEVKKIMDNGVAHIKDLEDKETEYSLTLEIIKKGLITMAKKEPQHFADLLSDNDDNTTGDVFLQCCLFGKVVYG